MIFYDRDKITNNSAKCQAMVRFFVSKALPGAVEVGFRELVIREPWEQRQQLDFQGFDNISSISKDNSPDG